MTVQEEVEELQAEIKEAVDKAWGKFDKGWDNAMRAWKNPEDLEDWIKYRKKIDTLQEKLDKLLEGK